MDLNAKLKVLVAEDSSFMKKLFLSNLKQIGLEEVTIANDGADGIDKLQEAKYDLIISDWNMPEKNGLELLLWARANDQYKETPFVMATAQGDKAKIEEARNAGANSHIAKPFNADQLKTAILKALGEEVEEKPAAKAPSVVDGKLQLRIGHIQITDHLALGVLKDRIAKGEIKPKYFDLVTQSMPGWNPIIEAVENQSIDGAFVLAPIAMDLFAYEVPIKLISFAHKNGSVFVRSTHKEIRESESLREAYMNKIVNIPHKMSIHNMLAHEFLSELGLKPGVPGPEHPEINVTFEVVPPIQMPRSMMLNKEIAGFIVAEPIGSNAINKGIAELQFLSKTRWKDHPCCIVAMRQEIIDQFPDAMFEFTQYLTECGKFADSNKSVAAEIAVDFLDPQKKLGLTVEVLKNVLEEPMGITLNDLYPVIDDLDRMQRYMHEKMEIGKIIDLEKFIDFRFANEAKKD
ncbi:MAG: ABC transporter substrate-binding protein [Spirochaetes bacterium]|nr:ABC transporter substrate-binding protein [Spirochaetota bacterium]